MSFCMNGPSRRPDLQTSGRPDIQTSRRPDARTPGRPDVLTSRRSHASMDRVDHQAANAFKTKKQNVSVVVVLVVTAATAAIRLLLSSLPSSLLSLRLSKSRVLKTHERSSARALERSSARLNFTIARLYFLGRRKLF